MHRATLPLFLRGGAILLVAAGLVACKDDEPSTPTPDAGAMKPCLERPTDPAKPPSSALPCDLLPPDFGKK
ncbi:hypothetical protein LVJ94_31955 [Pendulispora rubella]|uniref:Lipoprotein n=1 Tax=Pendulispora rubella TaxID=2741070 RepID=A0ABZ2KS58_9BACT